MLFDPLTFACGLVVPNRIALAPMTNGQSLPDGRLGDDEVAWLARRADGGFGMIETCAAYVARDGKAWAGELGVDRDDPGLARLAARIKRGGAAAIVQLFHGGVRAASKLTGEQVWSASVFHEDGPTFETPRAATDDDIARVIEQFAAAANCSITRARSSSVAARGVSKPGVSSCHVLALHTCSPVSALAARTPP